MFAKMLKMRSTLQENNEIERYTDLLCKIFRRCLINNETQLFHCIGQLCARLVSIIVI